MELQVEILGGEKRKENENSSSINLSFKKKLIFAESTLKCADYNTMKHGN